MTRGPSNDATAGLAPAVRRSDPPLYHVRIWPNRSLPRIGFRLVMTFAAVMLSLPLLPLLGTPAALGLAPFLVGAFGLLWWFIRRSYRDGALVEELWLWPDLIFVERREPDGRVLRWQANPFWVRLRLDPDARPENYLTLQGGGRRIELGAFLSPEERVELAEELEAALRKAAPRHPDSSPLAEG